MISSKESAKATSAPASSAPARPPLPAAIAHAEPADPGARPPGRAAIRPKPRAAPSPRGFDLVLGDGDRIGVVGPNGAGKTRNYHYGPDIRDPGRGRPQLTARPAPYRGGAIGGRQDAYRFSARARALIASSSRFLGGAVVTSSPSSSAVAAATAATARSNAAWLACDGRVDPATLRTYCSAAAWISSGVAGGSKLCSWWMLRHISAFLPGSSALLLHAPLLPDGGVHRPRSLPHHPGDGGTVTGARAGDRDDRTVERAGARHDDLRGGGAELRPTYARGTTKIARIPPVVP